MAEPIEWLSCREAVGLVSAGYSDQPDEHGNPPGLLALIYHASEGVICSKAQSLEITRPEEYGGSIVFSPIEFSRADQDSLLPNYLAVVWMGLKRIRGQNHNLHSFDAHTGLIVISAFDDEGDYLNSVRITGLQFDQNGILQHFGGPAPAARESRMSRPPGRPPEIDHVWLIKRAAEIREQRPKLSKSAAANSLVKELGPNPLTGKERDSRHITDIIGVLWGKSRKPD